MAEKEREALARWEWANREGRGDTEETPPPGALQPVASQRRSELPLFLNRNGSLPPASPPPLLENLAKWHVILPKSPR